MSAKIKAHLKQLLSQEQGAVVREWGARFPVALVYPQVYPVAMGNLGFQAIYHLLNAHPGFVCERAFLPSPGGGGRAPPHPHPHPHPGIPAAPEGFCRGGLLHLL